MNNEEEFKSVPYPRPCVLTTQKMVITIAVPKKMKISLLLLLIMARNVICILYTKKFRTATSYT